MNSTNKDLSVTSIDSGLTIADYLLIYPAIQQTTN